MSDVLATRRDSGAPSSAARLTGAALLMIAIAVAVTPLYQAFKGAAVSAGLPAQVVVLTLLAMVVAGARLARRRGPAGAASAPALRLRRRDWAALIVLPAVFLNAAPALAGWLARTTGRSVTSVQDALNVGLVVALVGLLYWMLRRGSRPGAAPAARAAE